MPQSAPALLIINGKRASNEALRLTVHQLRAEQLTLHVRVTWKHGDVARYVEEAARLGVGTVVAGGGDGTINEVASALAQLQVQRCPALGILPLGTANDFAMACNILLTLEPALQLAIKGCSVPIDLAKVNNERYFINMATGGFGIHITTETPEKLKAALGGVSYFIHGLLRMNRLQADRCEIRGPDFHCSGEALVIGIGNGKQAGGGQPLYPNALISVPHEMTFNLDGEPLAASIFTLSCYRKPSNAAYRPTAPYWAN